MPKIREAFSLLTAEQRNVLRGRTIQLVNYECSVSPFTGYRGIIVLDHEDSVSEIVKGFQDASRISIIARLNSNEVSRISELYGINLVFWNNEIYGPEDIKNYLDEGNLEKAISSLDEDELNFLKDYKIVIDDNGDKGIVENTLGEKLISIDYNESARSIRITIRDGIRDLS